MDRNCLIKSVNPETPHLYYTVGTQVPEEDFEVEIDGKIPIRFTVTRHFRDRGVDCVEFRPASWIEQHLMHTLRIRVYDVSGCLNSKKEGL